MQESNWMSHIDIATDCENIWFYSDVLRSVLEINVKSGKTKSVCDAWDYDTSLPYRGIMYDDNKVYILPYMTNVLIIYDVETRENKKVQLIKSEDYCYITGGVRRDEYIYFFGNVKPTIYKFDINTGNTFVIYINCDIMSHSPMQWFWTESSIHNNTIYLVMRENGLISLDLEDKVSYIPLGDGYQEWTMRNVVVVDDSINAIHGANESSIVVSRYDLSGAKLFEKSFEYPEEWNEFLFVHAEYLHSKWIVFPYKSNTIISVDSDTNGTIKRLKLYMPGKVDGEVITSAVCIEDDVYAINQYSGELMKLDIANNSCDLISIFFEEDDKYILQGRVSKGMKKQNKIFYESNEWFNLHSFIQGIAEDK